MGCVSPADEWVLGSGFVQRACQEGWWQGEACTGEDGRAWPGEVSEAWARSGEGWRARQCRTDVGVGWREVACAGEEFNR